MSQFPHLLKINNNNHLCLINIKSKGENSCKTLSIFLAHSKYSIHTFIISENSVRKSTTSVQRVKIELEENSWNVILIYYCLRHWIDLSDFCSLVRYILLGVQMFGNHLGSSNHLPCYQNCSFLWAPLCGVDFLSHQDSLKAWWALAGVAQYIECQPANQRVASSIPSQGTCQGCGPGPRYRVHERQTHVDASLPCFLPLFPFL